MFESIAVLVIFFFIIVFGLSFYMVISNASAKKSHERFLQLKAVQTVQSLSALPELECAGMGISIENCFDQIKIDKFSELLNTNKAKEWYFKIFGFSEINIRQIFQEGPDTMLYSNPLKDRGYSFSQIPVLIYNPIFDSFSFGMAEMKIYQN